MASPKFGQSTYGITIILDEGLSPGTPIDPTRLVFLFLTAAMALGVNFLVYSAYTSKLSKRSSPAGLPYFLLWAFILCNTIRMSHLLDHMYRPVYYHEPKWVYTKYIFTTVEVPLYIDIPIELFGLFGMKQLISDLVSPSGKMSVGAAVQLLLFSAMSAISLVHYSVEPPSNYGIDANFTIAGTVITAVVFGVLVVYGMSVLGNCGKNKAGGGGGGGGADEVKLLGGVRTRNMQKTTSGARRRSQTPKRDEH